MCCKGKYTPDFQDLIQEIAKYLINSFVLITY